jgi:putative PIN family toxin of toxin-antitoxin system
MIVVLDSNVIIASFATEGLCHSLFELCVDQHKIYICNFILHEVADKLYTKLKLPKKLIKEITKYLKVIATIQNPSLLAKQICRDKNDDIILSLAEASNADYLITGDNDLLILKKYKNVPIITPRGFWEILREKK